MYDITEGLLQEQFVIKLYLKELEQVANQYQLSKIDIDILLFLANHPEFNTAKDIVRNRFIAKSFVSKSLIHLQKIQYLSMQPDSYDRRLIRLQLLEKSKDIINDGRKLQRKIKETLCGALNEEEIKQFIIIISKVRNAFKQLEEKKQNEYLSRY